MDNPQPKSPFLFLFESLPIEIINNASKYAISQIDPSVPASYQVNLPSELTQEIQRLVQGVVPTIEEHYKCKVVKARGGATGVVHTTKYQPDPLCYNSTYNTDIKKWIRDGDTDFIMTVILSSDTINHTPTDQDGVFHYGGNFQFAQHDFTVQSLQGVSIIRPAGHHFITDISEVKLGNLVYAEVEFVCDQPWLYRYKSFPGTVKEWFPTQPTIDTNYTIK